MRFSYSTMSFGAKGQKIQILHMKKPGKKGLAGMVSSKLFPKNLALVVDYSDPLHREYDLAGLFQYGITGYHSILMDEAIFYGIKQGDKMVRTILFHELGHYYHNSLDGFEQPDISEEERIKLALNGIVSRRELDADSFAVKYLSPEYVIEGLNRLKEHNINLIKTNYCTEEDAKATLKELDLRIRYISEGKNILIPQSLRDSSLGEGARA